MEKPKTRTRHSTEEYSLEFQKSQYIGYKQFEMGVLDAAVHL